MYAICATAILLAFVVDPANAAEGDIILNGQLTIAGGSMCLIPDGTGVADPSGADACAELSLLEAATAGQYIIALASDTTNMQLTLDGTGAGTLTASGTAMIFSDGSSALAAVAADDVSALTATAGNVLLAAAADADPPASCLLIADATYTTGTCTPATDKWYFVITCESDETEHPTTSVCTACSTANSACTTCDYNGNTLECSACAATHAFKSSDKTCTACSDISDCSACSYSGDTLQCTTCATDGNVPSSSGTECVSCSSAIANCEDCTDVSTCTECGDGYGVADDDSCTACTVTNCATCGTDADACDACDEGYRTVSSTTCTECDVSNCKSCPNDVATCTECKDGYSLSGNSCNEVTTTTESGSYRVGSPFLLLLGAAIISYLMM